MASYNRVFLIGNLTRDPELRYTPNGSAVCEITLAINHRYLVGGQEKEDVSFIDIVIWAKQAESCGKYLHKGSSIFVEGRLKNETWEDKDGKKRSRMRVIAERVQFLTARKDDVRRQDVQQVQADNRQSQMPPPPPEVFENVEVEDDIPF